MKRLIISLMFSALAFAQPVRVDPNPVFTTSSNVPPGAYSPMLAIAGATIGINTTTFRDSTGAASCPSNAPVVINGTSVCVATSNAQGQFGFWVNAGTYQYTITLPNGTVFGPFALSVGSGGGGGGGGVTSITGTPNQVIASASTGAVTLSLPQSIAQTSTPTFAGIINNGAFNSTVTGSSISFQNSNTNFQVDGDGNISSHAQVNLTGGVGSSYKMGGVVFLDGNRNATVVNLNVTGTCTGCASGSVGSIQGTANQVLVNGTSGTPTTGAITLTTPQPIGTGSSPTFAGVTAVVFNSTATSSTVGFQLNNSKFIVNGNGDVTATGNQVTTGYVTSDTWFGLHRDTSTPGTTPGGGLSAINYKGGTSGLEVWLYDVVHSAWSAIDLGAAGSGITSINGQTGTAQTIAGTASQITATTTTNTVTLSLPASISTTNITATAGMTSPVFNSTATGSTIAFQLNSNNFFLDGKGNVTLACASGCTAGVDGANIIVGGYLTAGTFVGLHNTGSAPATTPGGGYSGISYKSGSTFWYYNTTTPGWAQVDFAAIGGGVTSVNGQTGPAITIAGTASQITATTSANTVTLSLPSSISITGTYQSTITAGGGIAFQIANGLGTPLQINGNGDISANGAVNVLAASSLSGFAAYRVNGTTIVDSGRNGSLNTLSTTGAVTSNATGASTAFALGNFNFLVNGNGAVSGAGVFSSTGASGGFNASACTSFNCVQASGGGGVFGRNLTALRYTNTGQNSGNPSMTSGDSTNPGLVYWDTSTASWTLFTSSSGYVPIVNSGGAFIGNGVNVGAFGISAGGYNVNGGFIGQTATVIFTSTSFTVGGIPYTKLLYQGGVLIGYSN